MSKQRLSNKRIGNRGELSEIYYLFVILYWGWIYYWHPMLKMETPIYYWIVKVVRVEIDGRVVEFRREEDVKVYVNMRYIGNIPINEFRYQAIYLYNELIMSKKEKRPISIPETQSFLYRMMIHDIKIPIDGKVDIKVTVRHQTTNENSNETIVLNQIIKSLIGGSPTLVNPSFDTTCIFEIHDLDMKYVDEINNMTINGKNDLKGRLQKIKEYGGRVVFKCIKSYAKRFNIALVDLTLGKIIGESLMYYYDQGIRSTKRIIEKLSTSDPLLSYVPDVYQYKFIRLLTLFTLGIDIDKKWHNYLETPNGFCLILESGDILNYDITDIDVFGQFLIDNTYLDTPSSIDNDFGYIYFDNNQPLIDYSLQVRFNNVTERKPLIFQHNISANQPLLLSPFLDN